MSDKNTAHELLTTIKTIVDNYMKARKPSAILIGTYNGAAVMIGALPVPISMLSGNMKGKIVPGDKLRRLRNDGGREYYILEIIGRPYQITGG